MSVGANLAMIDYLLRESGQPPEILSKPLLII